MVEVIALIAPDILVLQGVDYDAESRALTALRNEIAAYGLQYDALFALRPNTGIQTGHDMDGDGRLAEPEDAQGFGEFSGQGGLAVVSRFPIDSAAAHDFSSLLWRELPGATLPSWDGAPYPNGEAQDSWRLAAVAHWVVPVVLPSGPIHIMAFHASAPVFDGPEDRNGLRNRDQLRFWKLYLDGQFGSAPQVRFVLAGQTNQDPLDAEGIKSGIKNLLADPRLQDPLPMRKGVAAAQAGHLTDPRLDTVAWPMPEPGQLRVSYVLPSADWTVASAGVHWPPDTTAAGKVAATASRHRMVWVDLVMPD